jgi:hypothetical protein
MIVFMVLLILAGNTAFVSGVLLPSFMSAECVIAYLVCIPLTSISVC